MKTLKIILALVVLHSAQRCTAQTGLDRNLYAALRIAPAHTISDTTGRYELVAADLRTVTHNVDSAFVRVVRPAAEGYAVRIVSADGMLRMTGTYADAGLHTAHGEFHFYHANGELESTGMYINGNKKGTWLRYDANGKALAERNYGASNWEEVQVELGLTTTAARP